MLAIQLHRWRSGGSRGRAKVIRVLAFVSAAGCLLGGLLLRVTP